MICQNLIQLYPSYHGAIAPTIWPKLVSCGLAGSELNISLRREVETKSRFHIAPPKSLTDIPWYSWGNQKLFDQLCEIEVLDRFLDRFLVTGLESVLQGRPRLRKVSPPQLCRSRLRRSTRPSQLGSTLVYLREDHTEPSLISLKCLGNVKCSWMFMNVHECSWMFMNVHLSHFWVFQFDSICLQKYIRILSWNPCQKVGFQMDMNCSPCLQATLINLVPFIYPLVI